MSLLTLTFLLQACSCHVTSMFALAVQLLDFEHCFSFHRFRHALAHWTLSRFALYANKNAQWGHFFSIACRMLNLSVVVLKLYIALCGRPSQNKRTRRNSGTVLELGYGSCAEYCTFSRTLEFVACFQMESGAHAGREWQWLVLGKDMYICIYICTCIYIYIILHRLLEIFTILH